MERATIPVPCEIQPLVAVLERLRAEGRLRVALLYGSFAKGTPHHRSDIDVAVFLNATGVGEDLAVIDRILMATDREVSILRLDDPDESPAIVQEALKGVHLVPPDWDAYYEAADRALHESESLRFRRETVHE